MPKEEIERRFLVRPGWEPPPGLDGFKIVQGYLSSDPRRVVRVRNEENGPVLAIKGLKEGLSAPEFEYPIPEADYEVIIATMADLVEKTRFRVQHAGKTWEVDVFHGANAGLVVAEVELKTDSEEVELPIWVREDDEVTRDFRYSNSNLAIEPWSSWAP